MLFTIFNAQRTSLEERGYTFAKHSEPVFDKEIYNEVLIQRGKKYADGLQAKFDEKLEPVCLGEDEVFYTVLFENLYIEGENDVPCAVMWQEISLLGHD